MSTVNGLTPTKDQVTDLERLPRVQRAQVRDPSPDVPLQPVARPVDTYSRPAQSPGLRIAEALGQLNSALLGYAESKPKLTPAEVKAQAAQATAGMTEAEVSRRYLDGSLPSTGAPAVDTAIRTQGATYRFKEDAEWWKTQLPAWDYTNRNFDKEFTDFTSARYDELYKKDPASAAQYKALMDDWRSSAITSIKDNEFKAQNVNLLGALQTKVDAALTKGTTEKWDATKTNSTLDAVVNGFITDNEKRLGKKAINDAVVGRLKDLAADGSAETAQAILNYIDSDRTGSDGTKLPALSKTGTYLDDVRSIRHAAQTRIQHVNEQSLRAATAEQDARDVANGVFRAASQLDDRNIDVGFGKKITISGSDRLKAAQETVYGKTLPAWERKVYEQELARTGNQDAATAAAKEASKGAAEDIARRTGVLDPKLVKEFTNLGFGVTTASMSNPQERESIMKSFDTYVDMVEKNPQLARSYVTDNHTEDVLKSAWVLNKVARLSKTEALQTAAMANEAIGPDADKKLNTAYQEVDKKFKEFTNNPTNAWFFNVFAPTGSNADNLGQIEGEFRSIARSLIRAGKSTDQALEITKTYFQDPKVSGFMEINGNLLRAPKGIDPTEFKGFAKDMIGNYVAAEGKTLGYDPSQLTVRQNQGQNTWTLINKNGGVIERTNGAPATFTLRDLEAWRDQKRIREDQKSTAQQEKDNTWDYYAPDRVVRRGFMEWLNKKD